MSKLKYIEKKIKKIKEELLNLGELRPGSMSKQFNVCGKPSCRCKDKKNPRKHGPYYQISYSRKGKSSSVFVRTESVKDIENQLANYKRLMQLVNLWIDLAIEHSKLKLDLIRQKNKRGK
jgi:hypothetical protein